jgi:hypothetical protein
MTTYGTVTYNDKIYALTQDAYLDGPDTYAATATDADGNEVKVYWETVAGWSDHVNDADGDCVICGHTCCCDDESNACDWDTPSAVKRDGIDVEAIEAAKVLGRRGGKIGGAAKTASKTAAARENGKKGGRPAPTRTRSIIEIKTRLNSGIYKSDGGGETRVHYAYTTGPRNLIAAIQQLREHRADMVRCYGNIGCGSSWLEIDGQEIHGFDLEDVARDEAIELREYSHIRRENRTAKARRLIAEVRAGYDFSKYDIEPE